VYGANSHEISADKVAHSVHTAKLDALADLVEEQEGQPLLVAVAFQHEVDAIRKALGDDSIPYLGGGVSAGKSSEVVSQWNAGALPVLLAHPTSVAHGLNLQSGGNAVCWFSLTWNLEEFDQFNARVWRQGQTKPVTFHYIVAVDTIDGDVLDALRHKARGQSALMNALKDKRT
jgi:SNF2 family DNA or RNA helicase